MPCVALPLTGKGRLKFLSAADLSQGIVTGSARAVLGAAHKLKAAARSIGAGRLAELCVEIEQAAEANRADAQIALLPRFVAELEAVCRFLRTP